MAEPDSFLILAVFVAVYLGMVLGRLPRLRLDRTGIALLGALVLVASGAVPIEDAIRAVHPGTMALLLAFMVVSAQLRLGGFYTWLTRRVAGRGHSGRTLLAGLISVAAVLSAVFTNDVVCLALAPVTIDLCRERDIDPIPYLLALACASNVGSAATLIGNPQNILAGQVLGLDFGEYLLVAAPIALVSLVLVWLITARDLPQHALNSPDPHPLPALPPTYYSLDVAMGPRPFDAWQTLKGLSVTLVLFILFLVGDWPRELLALGAAGILLTSRSLHSREMLSLVDWQLLVLFAGLFVVNHALAQAGLPAAAVAWLADTGIHLSSMPWLFGATLVLSNIVSNVPAVMLLLPLAAGSAMAGMLLAIVSTLAGNLVVVGSIANLIVVDAAAARGIRITWRAHARIGVPVTVATLFVAALVLLWPREADARQVVINEFMASNAATIAEPDFGAFADWVELHNAGSAAVDLAGWTLTDNLERPDKWAFPAETVIGPGQFLLVWTDSRATGRHTSFSLDREGESIGLYDATGAAHDTLSFPAQTTDVSMGRDPAFPASFVLYPTATPGRANGSAGVAGLLVAPTVDPPAGLHASALTVTLVSPDGAVLRYTLDGSEPTPASAAYAAPIPLTATTVVRVRAFREGWQASGTTTATYLIGESPTLPVVALSTDPANFFDDRTGIYVVGTNGIPGYCRTTPHNWNQDWERPIHVEFYETDGSLAFAQDAGVKIFGGCTRIYAQKSLALYARKEYGAARFEYKVFADVDLESFNNLVLRSSAQDWWRTMFRDGLFQTLIRQGMSIETQAYRPALVFLNGQYWGIHNIREKLNEHYFADHFDLPTDGLEILQNDKDPIEGTSAHYDRILAYLRSTDMTRPENLEPVADWIDLDAYVDYVTAEVYSANADWPGNNLKLWRPLTDDGKWRWVIYDLDMGFGGNGASLTDANTLVHATTPNGTLWSNEPWATYVLRTLLTNPRFRDRFVQRFAAHMNTTFEPVHVNHVIDSLRANIAAEIPRHKQRWPQSISFTPTWDAGIAIVRDFARGRAAQVRGHFDAYFGLPGSARLHVDVSPAGSGLVRTAGVAMSTPDPLFFQAVPLELEAVAQPGYHFVGWQGASASSEASTTVTLTGDTSITAVFAPGATAVDEATYPSAEAVLDPGYPNPFETSTRVGYRLDLPTHVTVRVFDVLGREMARPIDAWQTAGRHDVTIDGAAWAPGIYWIRFEAGETRLTRRVTLIR